MEGVEQSFRFHKAIGNLRLIQKVFQILRVVIEHLLRRHADINSREAAVVRISYGSERILGTFTIIVMAKHVPAYRGQDHGISLISQRTRKERIF